MEQSTFQVHVFVTNLELKMYNNYFNTKAIQYICMCQLMHCSHHSSSYGDDLASMLPTGLHNGCTEKVAY